MNRNKISIISARPLRNPSFAREAFYKLPRRVAINRRAVEVIESGMQTTVQDFPRPPWVLARRRYLHPERRWFIGVFRAAKRDGVHPESAAR